MSLDLILYFCITWVFAMLFYVFDEDQPYLKSFFLLAWMGMLFVGFFTVYSVVYGASDNTQSQAEALRYVTGYIVSMLVSAAPVLMGIFNWFGRIEKTW